MRKLIYLLTLIAYLFGGVAPAMADVNSNMNSFWSNSLSSSNGRGPSAYQGQEAGYYSLGNYSYRTPIQNYSISSVSLPTVKGGCGGIDIFGGSFSLINSDQIVAMFKAVAQNAVGLLFQMAVKTLSELLGNEIEHMYDLVRQATIQSQNSCAMAQTAINDVVDWLPQSTLKNCISLGLASSAYVDEAAARAACGFGGQAEAQVNNAAGTPAAKQQPTNRNIAWEAIQRNPIFAGDKQLSELMMTLTGTFVITFKDDGTGKLAPNIMPTEPKADNDAYIDALLDGTTSLPIHKCDPTDSACLNFTPYGDTANVTGLKTKVDALINDMVTKIVTKQQLTADEVNLLGLSTIPLYKIASVEVAQNGLMAQQEMSQYSEAIAQDILIGWIKQNIGQVQQQALALQGMDPTSLNTWNQNLHYVTDSLDKKQVLAQQRVLATQALIERSATMEKALAANTQSRLGQSILYVTAKKPG